MSGLPRIVIVYAIVIPLALLLGYALTTGLATPEQAWENFVMVGLVLFVLLLPALIRWHHILLIFFWNAAFVFPFLPGHPTVWLVLAVLSFGISWLNDLLGGAKSLRAPELTRPLLFLGAVVILTGYLRGGLGYPCVREFCFWGKGLLLHLGRYFGLFCAFGRCGFPWQKPAGLREFTSFQE